MERLLSLVNSRFFFRVPFLLGRANEKARFRLNNSERAESVANLREISSDENYNIVFICNIMEALWAIRVYD